MTATTALTPAPRDLLALNEALLLGSVLQHEQPGPLAAMMAKRTLDLTATHHRPEAFVQSIEQDLRAPLRAMQGLSERLVEEAGATLNATCRDYAARINQSARIMDALLCDLLDFGRISRQRLELTSVDLAKIVPSVLSSLKKEIKNKCARVMSCGPWPAVQAHEATLTRVFFNLASNALKFTQPGMRPRLTLRAEEKKDFVRIWVEDQGPGIAVERQEQIFGLFTRVQGDRFAGTGMGLAIVQKGVERMGGRMDVESIRGRGSRFWFELRKAP